MAKSPEPSTAGPDDPGGDVPVTVGLFAGAKEAVGCPSVVLTLPPSASVGDVRQALIDGWPERADLWRASLFAVGLTYAGDEAIVPAGAEVVCLPPVSGG